MAQRESHWLTWLAVAGGGVFLWLNRGAVAATIMPQGASTAALTDTSGQGSTIMPVVLQAPTPSVTPQNIAAAISNALAAANPSGSGVSLPAVIHTPYGDVIPSNFTNPDEFPTGSGGSTTTTTTTQTHTPTAAQQAALAQFKNVLNAWNHNYYDYFDAIPLHAKFHANLPAYKNEWNNGLVWLKAHWLDSQYIQNQLMGKTAPWNPGIQQV